MPQRVYGIAVAAAGLILVLFLIILRRDLKRVVDGGSNWRRSLVTAGLLALTMLGIVGTKCGCKEEHRTQCYVDMEIPAASADLAARRLSQRLSLLRQLAGSDTLEPQVVNRALATFEEDILILENEQSLSQLTQTEKAKAIRDEAAELVKKVRARLAEQSSSE
jgi:hypothetical protein